jgi:2-polyprenyl-3-methyl-5-hydroxy-6-metoxy-1,4-benzoquinol methylase
MDKKLLKKYNKVYQEGEEKFWTFLPIEERLAMLTELDLYGKYVLDIGCGTGDFAAWMATAGADTVYGVDASKKAISLAEKKYTISNLVFNCSTIDKLYASRKRPDIITMVGVLEHTDDPKETLALIERKYMGRNTILAVSCPSFFNARGFIWVALKYLFNAPMSLTDKHEITPAFMARTCQDIALEIYKAVAVDKSWGNGEKMIEDYKQRLPKVFPDMDQKRIDRLIDFLEESVPYNQGVGANTVYFIRRK